ncbi:hypothetical protein [Pantoea endophytica]
MDSAKEIARDMLRAISLDDSGVLVNFAKGFISFSVSIAYLGYDRLDTEHYRNNKNDKYRIAGLVERGTFRKEVIERVIGVFMDDFTSRINFEKTTDMIDRTGANLIGKLAFSQLTGFSLGRALTANATSAFFAGAVVGTILYLGSEASRAIYTSRRLELTNPKIYFKLRRMGDLDLLYFIVQDIVGPFEKACVMHDENPLEFDKICEFFFLGLKA